MIHRYTAARWPPVVSLYLLEAVLQRVRGGRIPAVLERALLRVFSRGMRHEMSGRYADGGVARRFRFSVGNPHGHRHLTVTASPLSRYDRSRLGAAPIEVRWQASTGATGVFALLENGTAQRFTIAPGRPSSFVHIACRADHPGVRLGPGAGLPARRIIGFLDTVDT